MHAIHVRPKAPLARVCYENLEKVWMGIVIGGFKDNKEREGTLAY